MRSATATDPHEEPRRALGAHGEGLAVQHLVARGYEILERNFRTRLGELDVVARDGRQLVFCEVKTRAAGVDLGPYSPLAGIDARKRRRLRLMAREWLAQRQLSGVSGAEPSSSPAAGRGASGIRFDAIGVVVGAGGRLLELDHLEGAF